MKIIDRLQQQHKLIHFDIPINCGHMTIINGYYFSFDFVISIDEQRSCSLFIGTTRLYDLTINKLTDHLRNFTTDHPFHIVRYQRGHYRLLDPDGFDYIGQYVSLKDAKRTCKGNFTYGG